MAFGLFEIDFANANASGTRISNSVFTECHERVSRIDARRPETVLTLVKSEYVLFFGHVVYFKTGILRTCIVDP